MGEAPSALDTHSLDSQELYAPGYPVFMDLRGKRIAVIGAGAVAQRKIETLLSYGAELFVVAPDATERVRELASCGAITFEERAYQPGDLAGAVLAFSACGNPDVDRAICAEGRERNCPVNVVDVPQLCDFIVPSIVSRGQLQIAISTSGASPLEAKSIRRKLEGDFDESWTDYLRLMGEVRLLVKQRIEGTEADRRPVFDAAQAAGWRDRLAQGERIDAEAAYVEACEAAGVSR